MPPAEQSARLIYLGRKLGFLTRERVFRFPDGLEVDVVLGAQVRCQRVFFDEVHLITLHRGRGLVLLLVAGALFLFATAASLLTGLIGNWWAGAGVFVLAGLPAATAFVLRLALGLDVVTIHGRRSRAEMHFFLKKARAQEVYHQICRLARERQERVSREGGAG
ncbi:MAG TPA: hypothetical protein VJU18_03255 [Vicinamibacteria bacterium]|nr:hypothetical protein [Vicinamibacteria bacterium]